MPVVKFLRRHSSSLSPQRSFQSFDQMNLHTMMSKTIQFDELLNEDENYMHQRQRVFNDDDLDNYEIQFANPNTMKGLEKLNEFYIKPLLIRKPSLKPSDEHEMRTHDRKPLLSSSNGKKSLSFDENDVFDNNNNDDDDNEEDDLLVVNQLRQENFSMKPMKDKKRNHPTTSHDTL